MYDHYKKEHFPLLLEDPTVSEEDKRKIKDMLQIRRWNPYIRRHTSATEVSKQLEDSVLIDQYMGWSHAGNTRQKYQHYFNDDAFDEMLIVMDGLNLPGKASKERMKALLKPMVCYNCEELNKPESKFCVKCKYVLSHEGYNETLKEAEQQKRQMETMMQDMEKMKGQLDILNKGAEERGYLRPVDTETLPINEIPPKLLNYFFTRWAESKLWRRRRRRRRREI